MKTLWALLLAAAILTVAAGCSLGRPQNMDDLFKDGAEGITAIHMRSGNTGQLSIITGTAEIEALLDIIGDNGLSKSKDQGLRMGYLYSLEIYKGDKVANRLIVGGPRVKINRTYYDLNEEISPQVLDEFFSILEIVEE